jgi:hypothetical protein
VRAITRLRLEKLIGEWDRRIELHPGGLGADRIGERIHRRSGGGRSF